MLFMFNNKKTNNNNTTTSTDDGMKDPKVDTKQTDTPEARKQRWEFKQARELKQAKETIAKLTADKNIEQPKFTEESDPDGSKELEHKIAIETEKRLAETLSKLGLKEKIENIERDRERENFLNLVSDSGKDLEKYWITVDPEQAKNVLLEIEQSGWLTPRQLTVLAHMEDILGKLTPKKGMPSPGTWGKPNPAATPKTARDVTNSVLASMGLSDSWH